MLYLSSWLFPYQLHKLSILLGINISKNDFSHTAQTGLFVATSSNVIVDSNTFTDIGERLHVKFYLVNLLINIWRISWFTDTGRHHLWKCDNYKQFLWWDWYHKILEHKWNLCSGIKWNEKIDQGCFWSVVTNQSFALLNFKINNDDMFISF